MSWCLVGSEMCIRDRERDVKKAEVLWDCCAASGGKSILLFDICRPNINITVSDIRENILTNLQLRFKEAGINIQKKFVQDLSVKSGLLIDEKFSIVLCDVPCTGSGTWSRTPEQYYSFDESQIQEFANKQKAIVVNALRHLSKDGWFIYITCSVFKKENEEIVEFIQENYPCQLLEMKYLKGYNQKADTLFVAYFKG
jgi:16S rRNA (cytosine967-C5)-methyltransferase